MQIVPGCACTCCPSAPVCEAQHRVLCRVLATAEHEWSSSCRSPVLSAWKSPISSPERPKCLTREVGASTHLVSLQNPMQKLFCLVAAVSLVPHPQQRPAPAPTTARWFCLVPLRVTGVHALDDGGALLQRVARVAAELHCGAHGVPGVTGREVPVLDEGLVAMPLLEGCGHRGKGLQGPGGHGDVWVSRYTPAPYPHSAVPCPQQPRCCRW